MEAYALICLRVKIVRSVYGRQNDRMSIRKQRAKKIIENILGRGIFFLSLTKTIICFLKKTTVILFKITIATVETDAN